MSSVEQTRYTKPKEYPNIVKNVLGTAGMAIVGLAAIHLGADISHAFSIPFVEPSFGFLQNAASGISHFTEGIPFIGSGINAAHQAAASQHSFDNSLFSKDTIAFGTAVAGTRLGADLAKDVWTLRKRPEYFNDTDGKFIAAAEKIVTALKEDPKVGNKANNLDTSKIIAEVKKAEDDLSKLKVHWTAFLARPVSLFVFGNTNQLMNVVLDRETYDAIPGNLYNKVHTLLLENDATKLVNRTPALGEVTDAANEIARATAPKRTIFKNENGRQIWARDGGIGLTQATRITSGFAPFITGEDIDGGMTIALRSRLKKEKAGSAIRERFERLALEKATIIAGDEVKRRIKRYSVK